MSEATSAAAAAAAKEEKAQRSRDMLKNARFAIYVGNLRAKMDERFTRSPCLGLHATFGEKEVARLQAAIERHGRSSSEERSLESLSVPVDVLLQTLSFVPNPHDSRLALRKSATDETDQLAISLPARTMERLCCTNSTILFAVGENKNLLGGTSADAADLVRAAAVQQQGQRKYGRHQENPRHKIDENLKKIVGSFEPFIGGALKGLKGMKF